MFAIARKLGSIAALLAAVLVARAQAGQAPFVVYDNMFYIGKPDTAPAGLTGSNILYENAIWPGKQDYGELPDRAAFEALVRKHVANPGPLVLDIEELPLRGAADVVAHNLATLSTLADWARDAAPGKPVGYYGTNTLSHVIPSELADARELARHVDAFFPPAYTFGTDRAAWETQAAASVQEAHDLGPGKPVYLYMWPQFHPGATLAMSYLSSAQWAAELAAARRYADGIVLWSPSSFRWDDGTGWWEATTASVRALSKP